MSNQYLKAMYKAKDVKVWNSPVDCFNNNGNLSNLKKHK